MIPRRKLLLALTLACAAFTCVRAAPLYDENPAPDRTAMPAYPQDLAAKHVEGIVVLRVSIDPKGDIANVEVVKSTDARFEKSAMDCVSKKWHFKPAMKGGVAVASKVNIPIRFSL